jgi:hypothetical protein
MQTVMRWRMSRVHVTFKDGPEHANLGQLVRAAVPSVCAKRQRSPPHRRHHHLILEEALSILSFAAHYRSFLPAEFPHPPVSRNVIPGLFSSPPTPTPWLRYVLNPHPSSSSGVPYTHLSQQAPNQPRPYPGNNYHSNGTAPSGPVPGAVPLLPNQGRVIQQGSVRVLCIADVRGE